LLVVVLVYRQTQFIIDRVVSVLLLFVFAAIVALLLSPLVDRVESISFMRGRRVPAVLTVNVVILALLAALGMAIAPALVRQGRELLDFTRRLFPEQQELIDFSLVAAGTTLASYVRGQLLMALLLSTFTGVSLEVIGVHYALVIAVGTFFLELIPLAGAPIAM